MMRRFSKHKKFSILLMSFTFSLLFTGCHQDYIYISNEFGHKNVYNKSKTEVAFFKFIHVAKPPKNFGTSKTIYKKTALFIYNIETEKLIEIYNFKDLPSGLDNWIEGLSYQDNLLAFSIRPISSWKYYEEYKKQFGGLYLYLKDKKQLKKLNKDGFNPSISPDENKILYFTKDYENAVLWENNMNSENNGIKLISDSLNHYTKLIWMNDNEVYIKEPKNKIWKLINLSKLSVDNIQVDDIIYENEIDLKNLKELTKDISYKDWGINLNECVPKSKKVRIKEIITGYGSKTYRTAVLQEIQNELSKEEIKDILSEIGMYKENLSSYERNRYNNTSESVIEQLNILLDQKE